jgi:anti-sigma regulatory factor (Ser/Thr protein kinase)
LALHGDLSSLRGFVWANAAAAGLPAARATDFVLAVHEAVTNSLRYGGDDGMLGIWSENGAVICEVRDSGCIDQPLVGRERPANDSEGGRGLWLVNHLCDLA